MTQRLVAAIVALSLSLLLIVYSVVAKLPFATEGTGDTINVLGDTAKGAPIIQVSGHPVYPDDGDLRMTYVTVSPASQAGHPTSGWLTMPEALDAWFDPDKAVLPYVDIYPNGQSSGQSRQEGLVEMNTSMNDAVAVAVRATGATVPNVLKVATVVRGAPADGSLEPGDVIVKVDGHVVQTKISTVAAQDRRINRLIASTAAGGTATITVERGGERHTYSLTPVKIGGNVRIGITLGVGYDLPYDVAIDLPGDIGGPSAGLMFSLAVYDYLTPGSLTDGHNVAGTGTIDPDGRVGPIGGIRQKIATARQDGVELYFVPTQNCADALNADAGTMRLVRATSFDEARAAIEAWVKDPSAKLPSCESTAS